MLDVKLRFCFSITFSRGVSVSYCGLRGSSLYQNKQDCIYDLLAVRQMCRRVRLSSVVDEVDCCTFPSILTTPLPLTVPTTRLLNPLHPPPTTRPPTLPLRPDPSTPAPPRPARRGLVAVQSVFCWPGECVFPQPAAPSPPDPSSHPVTPSLPTSLRECRWWSLRWVGVRVVCWPP